MGLDDNHFTSGRAFSSQFTKTNWNRQGIVNNYNQIEIIASTEKSDFLILSETRMIKV